jgi:malonyl-CoA/methylmalonyl-CoA synthetase
MSTTLGSGIALIDRALGYASRTAILVGERAHTYSDLLQGSENISSFLLRGSPDLQEKRVGFLIPGGFEYIAVQWGIWRSGGIAVPLSTSAKEPELEHILTDAEVALVLVTEALSDGLAPLCHRLGLELRTVEVALGESQERDRVGKAGLEEEVSPVGPHLPRLSLDRRAMILYTSGTTSKPKGVVSTHGNIEAQIRSLIQAWGWTESDIIPLFLPLHHIHGIVNVLSCALWSGAQVEAFTTFDMDRILNRVGEGAYTVFMAVPTIYVKLIQRLESAKPEVRERWTGGFGKMRLMISGSAALPTATHEVWTRLTGQKLLERYGMTEIGMGLSNPLVGERRPGAVGRPLPGVDVRLVDEAGSVVREEGEPGEIQVRGPAVFTEYWRLPAVTAESFHEGWFRTGDMAVLEGGYYRILGRLSVDIIKSGGYKLSALEIEDVLRQHPMIQECAVVGVADELWGEAVAAAIKTVDNYQFPLEDLREWAEERLSKYKVPKLLKVVDDFPRNAMGKVMKPLVRELFEMS